MGLSTLSNPTGKSTDNLDDKPVAAAHGKRRVKSFSARSGRGVQNVIPDPTARTGGIPTARASCTRPLAVLNSIPDLDRLRLVPIALALLVSLAAGVVLVGWIVQQTRERSQTESTLGRLSELRRDAVGCQLVLAREEDAFRRFGRRVDSLRNAVRAYEDDGSVPEAVYEQYLAVFDQYNDAVPDWESRADSLRGVEANCRMRIQEHNRLADSVRAARAGGPG